MNIMMMPIFQSVTRWTEIYTYTSAKHLLRWTGLVMLVDYTKDSHFCLDYWSQYSISNTTRTIWFRTSSLKIPGKNEKLIAKTLHRTLKTHSHKLIHKVEIKNAWIQENWTCSSWFFMLWLEIGVRRGLIHQRAVVVEKLINIECLRKEAKTLNTKLTLWELYNISDFCVTSQRA